MKNNTAEYLFKIVIDSHKNSIEQYKTAATLLMTANGGAAIVLLHKNAELYILSIFILSIGMLISLFLLISAFIRSCILTEKLGEIENFLSIQDSIKKYTKTSKKCIYLLYLHL